ncbi:hypothetical protein D0T53_04510 [Dysgonomonas sp. 216]|uniref:hypothetical protein n=1 Tax=Dysgonomonas sp. 216 TaxID=2302934 RepID=UPI0013D43306|nr:hypothetical protein [Dysgonomonas sp. 216]NDW18180.1 hypothetical protein [Dysgonomonas sp. 216]
MRASDLSKLEKDPKFRKASIPKMFWFKKPAIYPPSALLFVALLGLLYLLNIDSLITLQAIPFVVLLLLGAIWLKATKKHFQTSMFKKDGTFKLCLAQIFDEKDKNYYMVSTLSDKRHDKHFISDLGKKASIESPEITHSESGHNTENSVFIKAIKKTDILKLYPNKKIGDFIVLNYLDKQNVILVKPKYLNF